MIPKGAKTVLASREAIAKLPNKPGTRAGIREGISTYFVKAMGGPVHMPEPANPRDAFVTWGGTFLTIAVVELVFNTMNGSFGWRGQVLVIDCHSMEPMVHRCYLSQAKRASLVATNPFEGFRVLKGNIVLTS